jgi:hypothetical protein
MRARSQPHWPPRAACGASGPRERSVNRAYGSMVCHVVIRSRARCAGGSRGREAPRCAGHSLRQPPGGCFWRLTAALSPVLNVTPGAGENTERTSGTHIMQELTAVRLLALAAGIIAGMLAALAGQI